MNHELLADGTVLLARCDLFDVREICDGLADLAEYGSRGYVTIHVMGPLSEHEEVFEVAQRIVRLNIQHHVAVGDAGGLVHLAVTNEGSWGGESLQATSIGDAYDKVSKLRGERVAVMVTGSHSVNMSSLVSRVKEE